MSPVSCCRLVSRIAGYSLDEYAHHRRWSAFPFVGRVVTIERCAGVPVSARQVAYRSLSVRRRL